MLKKLRKAVAKLLPGDSEKYLGTVLALATGNPLYAGIGELADPDAGFGEVATAAFLASQSPGIKGLSGGIGTPKDPSKLTFFEKKMHQVELENFCRPVRCETEKWNEVDFPGSPL